MSEPTNWQPEVDELNLRRKLALKMGGEERVNRQRELGKLTIRDRIDALVDPGSFHEIGGLAGYGTYEDREFRNFTPLPYIGGLAKVDGRSIVVGGEDFHRRRRGRRHQHPGALQEPISGRHGS